MVTVTAGVAAEDEENAEVAATGRAVISTGGLAEAMLFIEASVHTFFGVLMGSKGDSETGFIIRGELAPLAAETAAGSCA